jgi:hypothetical protein
MDFRESCLRRTLKIAHELSRQMVGARSTKGLACPARTKGPPQNEAGTRLAEIYNWLTEGFDTADLKEAKALLDELCC